MADEILSTERAITIAVTVDDLKLLLAKKELTPEMKKHYAKRVLYAEARAKINEQFK